MELLSSIRVKIRISFFARLGIAGFRLRTRPAHHKKSISRPPTGVKKSKIPGLLLEALLVFDQEPVEVIEQHLVEDRALRMARAKDSRPIGKADSRSVPEDPLKIKKGGLPNPGIRPCVRKRKDRSVSDSGDTH
ncbi:MAG: hypothetical protein ABR951_11320 [Candidatus Aminicenantales bacterium]|jgi:hypothetical protein